MPNRFPVSQSDSTNLHSHRKKCEHWVVEQACNICYLFCFSYSAGCVGFLNYNFIATVISDLQKSCKNSTKTGAWVAQVVKHLPSAPIISQGPGIKCHVRLPAAWGICFSPLPVLLCSLSLTHTQMNKILKKKKKSTKNSCVCVTQISWMLTFSTLLKVLFPKGATG